MKEKTIIRTTFTISFVGIFIILVMGEITEMPIIKISELKDKEIDSRVRIDGKILSVRKLTGAYLIHINDKTSTVPAIIFEENLDLKKGSDIEVKGKLTEYNNELEIIVDTIELKQEKEYYRD